MVVMLTVKGPVTCSNYAMCHKTESLQNHTAVVHRERERLGDQRNVGGSSCNWRRNGPNGPTLDVYDDYDAIRERIQYKVMNKSHVTFRRKSRVTHTTVR
jgi:hypothetical protein